MAPISVNRGAPVLAVSDFEASLDFYTRQVGFAIDARFDGPSFAILSLGPVVVCLAEQGHPSEDLPASVMTVPSDPSHPAMRLVLWVDDVAAVHRELVSRGVRMASEPWSPPWGGGRFFTQDPDGYLVEFEQLA
jgi:catechol 2,3-dioxygenase-like lactoylglutathione lyase family enzyme